MDTIMDTITSSNIHFWNRTIVLSDETIRINTEVNDPNNEVNDPNNEVNDPNNDSIVDDSNDPHFDPTPIR